ncbi:hypothetical protein [Thermoplasma acidophilum]|uniref:Uncharacterized protein n=1 Tax=Thermoplasma acidophilum (strain ATCC 25905 / DSM 1728 / JCM 9062 / NBRC 15155 / AMRC-C165) TaxID=273075 RepID=Q9HJ24_THEAC|nr:hypothetical protein [Thermoplasma acidophilum]
MQRCFDVHEPETSVDCNLLAVTLLGLNFQELRPAVPSHTAVRIPKVTPQRSSLERSSSGNSIDIDQYPRLSLSDIDSSFFQDHIPLHRSRSEELLSGISLPVYLRTRSVICLD